MKSDDFDIITCPFLKSDFVPSDDHYDNIIDSWIDDFNWTCPEIEKKETVSNLTNNENDITVKKEEKIYNENEMKDEEEENSEEDEEEEEEDDYNEDSDNENKEENVTKKRKLENEQEMDVFTKEIYDTNKLITTQIKQ